MKNQSPQGDYREEQEEGSEDKNTILTDGGFVNQREYTNGCLNCKGVPTYGCSQLYVSDIEIIFEIFFTIQISHEHEY